MKKLIVILILPMLRVVRVEGKVVEMLEYAAVDIINIDGMTQRNIRDYCEIK